MMFIRIIFFFILTSALANSENESEDDLFELISSSECRTLSQDDDTRAKLDLPCVFPFTFLGETYNGCTTDFDPDELLWCATMVDENKNYIINSTNYGHCSFECPIHRPEVSENDKSNLEIRASALRTYSQEIKRCSPEEVCIFNEECSAFVEDKNSLEKYSRGSVTFRKRVGYLKGLICNQANRAVCCDGKDDRQGGKTCSKPCVTADNCPEIVSLFKEGTRSSIIKIRSMICDGEKNLFCCPSDEKQECSNSKNISSPGYLPINSDLKKAECGDYTDNSYIVGGRVTKPGAYPSSALLGIDKLVTYPHPRIKGNTVTKTQIRFICGGVLINRWYVLTAAHCKNSRPVTKVVLGEWDTSTPRDCTVEGICQPPPQYFDIKPEDNIEHPGFKIEKSNVLNDIMLIRLPRMATINDAVQMVCLPLDMSVVARDIGLNDIRDGLVDKRPHVVGWGHTNNRKEGDFTSDGTGSASNKQMVLEIPVRDAEACIAANFDINKEAQICAGGESGKDSCSGDSGGPLYMSKFSSQNRFLLGHHYLLGLVSYGVGECGSGKPAVYTRVDYHLKWIKETITDC